MAPFFSWSTFLTTFLAFVTLAAAYRPVQHCKQLGDNGHYSACTSLTQHYNQTTSESDLYVRYHWYKYQESKNGWHAFGLGNRMAGALMFIIADGHHPPLLIHDIDKFNTPAADGRIPEVNIVTSKFEPYSGPYEQPELHLKPTHVGIAEFIVRGHSKWIGTTVSNTSTAQPMIWSSKYDQDFDGDYSIDRSVEMHAFGLGFGFIFADLFNSATPVPMFGAINEQAGHKGLIEIGEPAPPTAAELSAGDFAIQNARLDVTNADLGTGSDDGKHNPFSDHNTTPSTMPESTESEQKGDNKETIPVAVPGTTTPDAQSRPTYTIKGKTIRDWLWHIHGLLMSLTFFLGYPLGIYLLRSQKQITEGTSFNHHWTVQVLATVTFSLGCFLGYVQSRSISLTHQYVGIVIAFCIGAQMLLGWRHHVKFLQFKRKTIMSKIHVGLGRVILPLGFINILAGMRLRQYGWFTMLLVFILIVIEVVFGAVYLRGAHVRRAKIGPAAVAEELKAQGPGKEDNAEEYFMLADEDELSDSDEEGPVYKKREQKRVENERLAKLDRV
ncbi:hypothetical protein LTR70_000405 [Exophiala xenobiotica]|uniref:Cytochrome b561 domain-containing protein n=1 Tax=Lithohypha guttulata TaxID=1690604 RepID=A0ABR0KPT4_9EURO|nr:hypothetical protein LTR24_000106 [Lithohypha guttulata]KAK5330575.1 hypothetical protein LTR70_000405 [Exophiala xenobiotica]